MIDKHDQRKDAWINLERSNQIRATFLLKNRFKHGEIDANMEVGASWLCLLFTSNDNRSDLAQDHIEFLKVAVRTGLGQGQGLVGLRVCVCV